MDWISKYISNKNFLKYFWLIVTIYLFSFSGYTHKVNVDEPWESITAWQLINHGKMNNPVLENRDYYDIHLLEPRILQSVLLAPIYGVFGLDLWVGRVLSLLMALLALLVFNQLLKVKYNDIKWQFLGVGLLLVHNLFYVYSKMIRPEAYLTFQAILVFYLIYRGLGEKSTIKLFFAGLVAGIGILTHPNFLMFCVAFFVIILIDQKKDVFKTKLTISFIVGSIIGFLPFVIYLVIQDFDNGFTHFWAQVAGRVHQGEENFLIKTLVDELSRYKAYIYFPYRLLPFLIELTFFIFAIRIKNKSTFLKYSLTMWAVVLVMFPFYVSHRVERYFLPLIPFQIITVLEVLKYYQDKIKLTVWLKRLVALLLIYQILGNMIITIQQRTQPYNELMAELRTNIPSHSKVWGSMQFWFGFSDCDYRAQYTYLNELYTFKPEYVITNDESIWGRKNNKTGIISKSKNWVEVASQMNDYCEKYGTIAQEFKNSGYGDLKLWKINTALVPDSLDYIKISRD